MRHLREDRELGRRADFRIRVADAGRRSTV